MKKKKTDYVGMSTKKIHHWSTSWKVMANEKIKKENKSKQQQQQQQQQQKQKQT